MSFVLLIDTSAFPSSVGLARDGYLLAFIQQHQEKFTLQPALQDLLHEYKLEWKDIAAIAVTEGPGSYTGLRVGMAAAKGLCYPFKLPLITIGTLHAMAQWGIDNYQEAALICPMIDARRQEVFTAIFDRQLNEIMSPQPMVLKADSFAEFLHSEHSMLFVGNGAEKWAKLSPGKLILNNKNLLILEAMAKIAHVKTENKDFADLFYATPAYLKDFYNPGC